jgi:hypothetical protein
VTEEKNVDQSLGVRRTAARPSDSGNALVVALLVLMVMTSAGVAYIAVTKSEKQIAGNAMTASQAMYAAEAGLAEGLNRMAFPAETLIYVGPTTTPVAGWGKYIVLTNGASLLDPNGAALATDGKDNDNDGFIDESGERYPEVLTKQTVDANALVYPFVRVEFKTQGNQLVRFGDADNNPATPPAENLSSGAPVLRITASGRRGNAAKTLEAEAVRFPLVSAASAMWMGGPMVFNGNSFLIDGHDHGATAPYDTIPGAAVPAILTRGPVTDADLSTNQQDNVTGNVGDNSVAQSTYTYDFPRLWGSLSPMANNSFTGDQHWTSATSAYGTLANPKITAVNGNLDISGTWTGGGILIVNGNLSLSGGCMFKGVVICLGDIDVTGGGPADVAHIIGAVIYQGTMIEDNKTSGSGRIFFSTEAINAAMTLNRYTLTWWRER